MDDFEFLEHTADLKFRSFGKTLEDAFGNAAKAVSKALIGDQFIENRTEKSFEKSAGSLEVLLHDFLSELIFYFETEHYVPLQVTSLSIRPGEEYVLSATVLGGWLDFTKHRVETEVKAVTYHDMLVKESEGGWIIQVVCDI